MKPDFFSYLYDMIPLQCHICGLRWGDDPKHHQLYDTHLDIHFRKARRSQDPSFRRNLARQWYPLNEQEWKSIQSTNNLKTTALDLPIDYTPPGPAFIERRRRYEGINPNYSEDEDEDEDLRSNNEIQTVKKIRQNINNGFDEENGDEPLPSLHI